MKMTVRNSACRLSEEWKIWWRAKTSHLLSNLRKIVMILAISHLNLKDFLLFKKLRPMLILLIVRHRWISVWLSMTQILHQWDQAENKYKLKTWNMKGSKRVFLKKLTGYSSILLNLPLTSLLSRSNPVCLLINQVYQMWETHQLQSKNQKRWIMTWQCWKIRLEVCRK